jgi:hypothetical protein
MEPFVRNRAAFARFVMARENTIESAVYYANFGG